MGWFRKQVADAEREALTLGEAEIDKIAQRVVDLLLEELRHESVVVLRELAQRLEG